MFDFLSDYYLSIKSIHIISVISWMAGLFYLPRLFVYHVDSIPNGEAASLFGVMEERLYRIIMTPAMILSLATGVILASIGNTWSSGWMHLKLISILALVVFHLMLNRWRRLLSLGICQKSSRFFRLINEVPTILLIIIVVSVVLKPF